MRTGHQGTTGTQQGVAVRYLLFMLDQLAFGTPVT